MLDPNKTPEQYADAFVHLLLSHEDAVAFESKCGEDKTFALALDEARRRKALLESAPPIAASEKLVSDTIASVREKVERRARNWRIYRRTVLGLTTAAVIMIAVFQAYFHRLEPTPYDVRILGQRELLSGTNAALRVAVFNKQTAKEIEGVPVRLMIVDVSSGESVELASYTSGDEPPTLKLPDWDDGEYQLRVIANPKGGEETLVRPLELTRQWKLMLSSDKPIYQPGQTIHLRSLALRKPDLRPVKGERVVFTITDPKGNMIFKHSATGSRFGIAATDCVLATEIIEGQYNVACTIGNVTSEMTVKVEKYVLPKFNIGITLDKPFYQPGETVEGTLAADYFFGQPVAGGEVNIEVRGTDVEHFNIASINDQTSAQGQLSFRFTLPNKLFGRDQTGGNAEFALVATVTDTAGQKYSRGAKRIVTSRPIQIEVIPESGSLVKGVENKIYLFASYVDGRPANVEISVNGGAETATTNKLGVAELAVQPDSNSISMTLVADDQQGHVGRKHVTLTAGQVASDFIVRTDKATYNGGDTLTLSALGGGVEPIFVDFLKDGQTILTTSVSMADGAGEYQFDIPPDMFGTIRLVAYRFGRSGLPMRKTRTIFVRQSRQLNIAATLDKDEYRPGVSATLNLRLTDDDGDPVPGAISLAAVDEAVFAVLGQRPGMEEVFFLLEEEMLQPIYAIYDWDPFAEGELPPSDVVQLEQALFARTTCVVGGFDAVPEVFSASVASNSAGQTDQPFQHIAPAEGPRSERSPFTLAAASYPEKFDRVWRQRDAGLAVCTGAWWLLLGLLVMVGWTTLLVQSPKLTIAVSSVLLSFVVCGGLLLSTAFFRATADRVGVNAMAPQANMDMAMEAMEESPLAEMAPTAASESPEASEDPSATSAAPVPRVREWFPETLLWRPQIVTDDSGNATLEIPLADSITTWRLTTSAVSAEGQLGSGQIPIRVFQPFFVDLDLPVALTRNDQVSVPVVVYNYLDEPQEVQLTFADAEWFSRLDDGGAALESNPPLSLELEPREIRSLHIPMAIKQVGQQQLQVTAIGSGISDAIRRQIEVVADGRRVEQVVSGTLGDSAEMTLTLPDDYIEGSARAIVKLYPSAFSQLVEGLDGIFRMPNGCFEQTSSTTYPNVLALDYLRRTKLAAPEIEAKARQYIHTGYQRLVSFEVTGGGFDWFGNPPANRTLTAYGLMEFEDMAQVHDVDPRLIERTRQWLLSQRQADGRWQAEPNMLDDGLAGSVNRGEQQDLAATAYIAWSVFGTGQARDEAQATLDYLLVHEPSSIQSPYILAIIANCIAGIDPRHSSLDEYLARIDELKISNDDGTHVFWGQGEDEQTMFYGDGRSGDIETTAMATLALLNSGRYPGTAKGALAWLISQKDANGTWYSTQATVLTLKALVQATGSSLGGDKARKIDIALGDKTVRTIDIPIDQAEVMQQISLTDHLYTGDHRLAITDTTDAGTGYQVAFWYHVNDSEASTDDPSDSLSIDIAYDRTRLQVDERVTATAAVVNNMDTIAPMVILDLPIPGGFKIEAGELDELVGSKKIAKYQITARKAVVYLRGLQPGQQLELNYRLRATMPVKVAVPPAAAYEYYNPDRRSVSEPATLEAKADA